MSKRYATAPTAGTPADRVTTASVAHAGGDTRAPLGSREFASRCQEGPVALAALVGPSGVIEAAGPWRLVDRTTEWPVLLAGFPGVPSVAHRRIRRRLETWLDGELGPFDARWMQGHLEECPDCLGEAELLRRIKASLVRLDRRRPPALATARLRRWAEELAAGHLR